MTKRNGQTSGSSSAVSVLLAGIVHELRNPLFALGATVDALEQRLADRDDVAPHLGELRGEIARLVELARDLGDLTTPLEPPGDTDVGALFARLVGEREAAAREAEVTVVTRIAATLPVVPADPGRLAQGLGRLLDFALARTPAGGSLAVHAHAVATPAPGVRLVVIDAGGAVPAADLADAVAPFGMRRAGRLSLDLALAATVAEQHGGGMTVENAGTEGLRYVVTLPAVGE